MNHLRVECVFPKTPKQFNKFVRGLDLQKCKVVNYISIRNKLTKADPYQETPSDSIVGLTITNEIFRSLKSEKKPVDTIIYLLSNVNYDTLANLKNMIKNSSDREFEINLTLLFREDDVSDQVSDLFNSVKYIVND